MKTFKKYLREQDLNSIMSSIQKYKIDGEITNPDYQGLTNQARKIFEKEAKKVQTLVLNSLSSFQGDEELRDLYYSTPDSLSRIGSYEKKLAKLEKKSYSKEDQIKISQIILASRDFINTWNPVANDLKELKLKVVKMTTKRAEAKKSSEIETRKKSADSSALINLLKSHIEEYKTVTREQARKFLDSKINELEKAQWDLNKVAPAPSSLLGRSEYKIAQDKRNLYMSITSGKSSTIPNRDLPYIRNPDSNKIASYINKTVESAESSYNEFIAKMVSKIGKPVIEADLKGNIWTNATLTVKTDDGEIQKWSTQIIINFSKYQRMFNQFPTRRIK